MRYGGIFTGITHVLVSNIATASQDEKDGLPPLTRGGLVGEQTRADDTDGVDALIPDVVHGLGSTARETRGEDLGGINIGVRALTGVLGDPVDGLLHGLRVRGSAAVGSALGDSEETVADNVLEERLVGTAVVAACAVAPDNDRLLLAAGVLGRVVDGVVTERVVRLVGSGSVLARAAGTLVFCQKMI